MTGFNHVLTGVAIAVAVRHPVVAPFLSLISHFTLDSLPHFGNHPNIVPFTRRFKIYLVAEITLMLAIATIAFIAFPDIKWLVLACAALAFLPDFLWTFESYAGRHSPKMRAFYNFHYSIQTVEHPRGWIVEAGYFSLLILLLSAYT